MSATDLDVRKVTSSILKRRALLGLSRQILRNVITPYTHFNPRTNSDSKPLEGVPYAECPVSSLPPELLCIIFSLDLRVGKAQVDLKALLRIAGVCQFWRYVVHSDRLVWNGRVLMNLEVGKVGSRLSGDGNSLRLTVDLNDTLHPPELGNGRPSEELRLFINPLTVPFGLRGDALFTLHILRPKTPLSVDSFPQVLAWTPNLRELYLDGAFSASTTTNDCSPPKASLSHLRVLEIRHVRPIQAAQLSKHICVNWKILSARFGICFHTENEVTIWTEALMAFLPFQEISHLGISATFRAATISVSSTDSKRSLVEFSFTPFLDLVLKTLPLKNLQQLTIGPLDHIDSRSCDGFNRATNYIQSIKTFFFSESAPPLEKLRMYRICSHLKHLWTSEIRSLFRDLPFTKFHTSQLKTVVLEQCCLRSVEYRNLKSSHLEIESDRDLVADVGSPLQSDWMTFHAFYG